MGVNWAGWKLIWNLPCPLKVKLFLWRACIQEWDALGKYLGLLAQWRKSKRSTLSWIKDVILGKINRWKEKLLNPKGKEVIIKAVVQSIPNYTMSILLFPKRFYKELCARVTHFCGLKMGGRRAFTRRVGNYWLDVRVMEV